MGSQDLQKLRDEQAGQVCEMSDYELNAYNNGFPPVGRCVATPESFKEALAKGEVEIAVSPLSLAQEKLSDRCGPQNTIQLGVTFGQSANTSVDDPIAALESTLKNTRTV